MRQRALIVVAYFAVWTTAGALGYMAVEGWSLGDSFYMTIITLTAVGYQEVHPLTPGGRALTSVLLFGGISGMGLWFAIVTAFVVRLDLRDVLRRRRMTKKLAHLKDHVIVCGGGRTGRQVLAELSEARAPFVVIEIDEDIVDGLRAAHPDAPVIHGDATQDRVLKEAGIERAAGLLSCLEEDTDNLFVCLSARTLCPDLTVVARAYDEEAMAKMYRTGADHVISPNVTGAIQMASVLVRPSVVSFLDVATRAPHLSLRLEQTAVGESSPVAGRTLSEARIPQHTGLIVIAVRRGEGHDGFVFNPMGSTLLEPGNELIVLGTTEQVESLKAFVAGA
ncbi:MAG: potassium channel protein [Gemmatimonadetes bacterium]|nr:potassium channel protein [Gemmatimonadota bacterium]